jgi:hypothetical protein
MSDFAAPGSSFLGSVVQGTGQFFGAKVAAGGADSAQDLIARSTQDIALNRQGLAERETQMNALTDRLIRELESDRPLLTRRERETVRQQSEQARGVAAATGVLGRGAAGLDGAAVAAAIERQRRENVALLEFSGGQSNTLRREQTLGLGLEAQNTRAEAGFKAQEGMLRGQGLASLIGGVGQGLMMAGMMSQGPAHAAVAGNQAGFQQGTPTYDFSGGQNTINPTIPQQGSTSITADQLYGTPQPGPYAQSGSLAGSMTLDPNRGGGLGIDPSIFLGA